MFINKVEIIEIKIVRVSKEDKLGSNIACKSLRLKLSLNSLLATMEIFKNSWNVDQYIK